MSVSFYGLTADKKPIMLDFETDPAHLNMASGNARTFLEFLGLEPGEEPSGDCTMPEARRAVIRAKATFERKVGSFTREGSDTQRPGRARVVMGALGEDYFEHRLNNFERFLNAVAQQGAVSIYWA
jgi:hypothetical protein